MARIVIELPEMYTFDTEIPICIGHINYGNHLDNVLLLSIVSEARLRYFKSMGFTELDVEGTGIIVGDAAVQYRSEAFHGEVMVVSMVANDFSSKGCDLVWQMNEKTSGREVARGKTGIVFFDYTNRTPAPVPIKFRNLAEKYRNVPSFLINLQRLQQEKAVLSVPAL